MEAWLASLHSPGIPRSIRSGPFSGAGPRSTLAKNFLGTFDGGASSLTAGLIHSGAAEGLARALAPTLPRDRRRFV